MRYARVLTTLPLLGGLFLVGCRDGEPTAPMDDNSFLTQEDAIALDVLSFEGGIDAALALADGPVAAAGRRGMGFGRRAGAVGDASEARLRFQEAIRLLAQGDSTGAAVRAREARRLVARAGQAAAGGRFAVGAVERMEAMIGWVADNPGSYVDPAGLQAELNGMANQARLRLQQRDSLGAGERGVLAEQRLHHRRRHGDSGTGAGGAETSVALGASAVALATRLLDEQSADEEQLLYLETAAEYQRAAEAALDAGDVGRAIQLSNLAEWTALKAVVLPGGVTDEEVRALLELAESLYADAVAGDLTEEQTLFLQRARTLIDHGTAALESGTARGVVPIWRAAVICAWIIG